MFCTSSPNLVILAWTCHKSSRADKLEIDTQRHTQNNRQQHYNDVIMGMIASQITSLTIVYSIVYSEADQRKHQSSAWLAFVRGIHRGPVNSPHKRPVTRKMFPIDDVIMIIRGGQNYGSAEGPPHVVENRNLLSYPDDLRMEAYVTRMT